MDKKELLIIKDMKEKGLSARQAAKKLNKSLSSIKHMYSNLYHNTTENINFILQHKECTYQEIDKLLNFQSGTTKTICILNDIKLKARKKSYTEKEINLIKKYYSEYGLKDTAKLMNISETRVRVLASKLNLKRNYQYSPQEELNIINDFKNNHLSPYDLAKKYNRSYHAIESFLSRRGLAMYNNVNSPYYISKPERYMIEYITSKLNITVPDKTKPENRDYYYNVVDKYEIDLPIYIGKYKFAIEYDGERWHNEEKDKIKTKALEDAGYIVLRISSKDHNNNYNDLSSLNNKLDEIVKTIKNMTGSL